MGYNVKVMKGQQESEIYPCSHYRVMQFEEETDLGRRIGHPEDEPLKFRAGVHLTLFPSGREITLPDDGDTIYVTNQLGKTIDTYRWPPKNAQTDQQQDEPQEIET